MNNKLIAYIVTGWLVISVVIALFVGKVIRFGAGGNDDSDEQT